MEVCALKKKSLIWNGSRCSPAFENVRQLGDSTYLHLLLDFVGGLFVLLLRLHILVRLDVLPIQKPGRVIISILSDQLQEK